MSDAQHETLDLAVSQGYYSVPRETTTGELAEQLGISDQAVVERLRRAMTRLGEEYLRQVAVVAVRDVDRIRYWGRTVISGSQERDCPDQPRLLLGP